MIRLGVAMVVLLEALVPLAEHPRHLESKSFPSTSIISGGPERAAVDSLLQSIARATLQGANDGVSVWPGWGLPTEFVVCRPKGSALLVLGETPPDRFGPYEALDLGPGHTGYLYLDALPGLRTCGLRIDFPVADRKLVTFPVVESTYSVVGAVPATAIALFHESFHQFQARSFAPGVTGPALVRVRLPSREILESPEFEELASLERQLLVRALDSPSLEESRATLRRYLAVRWTRLQLVPGSVRGAEAHEERKEATANVAGYEAGIAVFGSDLPPVVELVKSDLRSTPSFAAPSPQPGGNFRQWHIYATGAAIALCLDRLDVDWREGVQGGSTLVGLLATTLGWDDSMVGPLFEEVRGGFGRSAVLSGPTGDN